LPKADPAPKRLPCHRYKFISALNVLVAGAAGLTALILLLLTTTFLNLWPHEVAALLALTIVLLLFAGMSVWCALSSSRAAFFLNSLAGVAAMAAAGAVVVITFREQDSSVLHDRWIDVAASSDQSLLCAISHHYRCNGWSNTCNISQPLPNSNCPQCVPALPMWNSTCESQISEKVSSFVPSCSIAMVLVVLWCLFALGLAWKARLALNHDELDDR
jgi:hypothetical protein